MPQHRERFTHSARAVEVIPGLIAMHHGGDMVSHEVQFFVETGQCGLILGWWQSGLTHVAFLLSAASSQVAAQTLEAICELFPTFRRLRMLRNWGGIVDCTPDRSPIIGLTPVPGLFVNCGWGTGGFKATPGSGHVFAATIARGEPHSIAAPFSLDRFCTGSLIDEAAAAAVSH